MRRDISFYIEAKLDQVYQAYLNAAVNPPFERTCDQEPYHTISFGVNYSFKYNMNGGRCTIHLMPYNTGTAVNFRFSIAQAAGARYEKYAHDLNTAMQRFLPLAVQHTTFNIDDFLRPENKLTPATFSTGGTVAPAAPAAGFCTNCGNALSAGVRFCPQCGTPVAAPAKKVCPNCQTQAAPEDAFCANCGTRL